MSVENGPRMVPGQEGPDIAPPENEKKGLKVGERVFGFLDRAKLLDLRKSDEKFDAWLQGLTFEDYSGYITRLNGMVREVPIKKRTVDGHGVELSSTMMLQELVAYLPPSPETKDELMEDGFEVMKRLPDNEDRALLNYYLLQAVHPYADGNGRTGRLLHEIFSEEGKGLTKDGLSALLDHDAVGASGKGVGRDVFAEKVMKAEDAYAYVNREAAKDILGEGFLQEHGRIYVGAMAGEGHIPDAVKKGLSSEDAKWVEKILGESDVANFEFRGLVLAKLASEKPDFAKYLSSKDMKDHFALVPEDRGKKMLFIEADDFMDNLTAEDAKRIIEIHKEIKQQFIKGLIDVFEHPEQHRITTKGGEEIPVKDVFRILM